MNLNNVDNILLPVANVCLSTLVFPIMIRCWVILYAFCRLLIFFFKIIFFEKFFQEYHQSIEQFESDQARCFVSPVLCPNCLQKLSADGNRRQNVKVPFGEVRFMYLKTCSLCTF